MIFILYYFHFQLITFQHLIIFKKSYFHNEINLSFYNAPQTAVTWMIFYLLNNSEKKVFCSSYPPLPDILYLTKQKQVQQICIRKNKCQVLASFPSKFRMSPVLNILEKVQCQQLGIDQFLFLICRHNCSCNCFSLFLLFTEAQFRLLSCGWL